MKKIIQKILPKKFLILFPFLETITIMFINLIIQLILIVTFRTFLYGAMNVLRLNLLLKILEH